MKKKRAFLGNIFGKNTDKKDLVVPTIVPESKKEVIQKESEEVKLETCPGVNQKVQVDTTPEISDPYFRELMLEGQKQIEEAQKAADEETSKVVKTKPFAREKEERFRYKPLIHKTMVIVLLEESTSMNEYASRIARIINGAIKDNCYCIIRYGESSSTSKQTDVKSDSSNDKVCFFDAIGTLNEVIASHDRKITEDSINRFQIEHFEIIGIGTCSDNASTTTYEEAGTLFNELLSKKVKAKYFCTNENLMPKAAAMGFRSIGSLSKEY